MISPFLLLALLLALMAALVAVGVWAERRAEAGRDPTANAWVYSLGFSVYCTTWTFYGSVGSAARSGLLYVTVYLGPTLVMMLAWGVLRRMIHLRRQFNIASLADLVAVRYGQSARLGAFVTLALLVGLVPYISLQLRALMTSFSIVTGLEHSAETFWQGHFADEAMIALIGAVTAGFGLRRLDTRVRQSGLLAMIAVEGVGKLLAFMAVGVFVTFGLHDGLGDLEARLATQPALALPGAGLPLEGRHYLEWMSYLVLSMGAVLFLPRMFHVAVVENHDERHIATAMWVFPLYLLLISLFVVPIAVSGRLHGYPLAEADWLVIRLPMDHGGPLLTLAAFLGGFMAGIGFLMVTCTTLAIMVSNHVLLPLLERLPAIGAPGGLLRVLRWAVVFLLLGGALLFEHGQEGDLLLIRMGLISFAFVLQFAPAVLGGLYWSGGSRSGAWWGLGLGWLLWAYTLLLPALSRGGALPRGWLEDGPLDIAALRPELLFGLDLGSPFGHAVFWSMLANLLAYLAGSVLAPPSGIDHEMAGRFTRVLDAPPAEAEAGDEERNIEMPRVVAQVDALLARYLPPAERALARREALLGIDDGGPTLSGAEFMRLSRQLEIVLAGYVGAASARQIVDRSLDLPPDEKLAVERSYLGVLAELRITPDELRERVDHFRSMSGLNALHARQLAAQVEALRAEAAARSHAEQALRETEARFRTLADSAPVMIWMSDLGDGDDYFNRAWCEFTGRSAHAESAGGWKEEVHPDDLEALEGCLAAATQSLLAAGSIEFRLRRNDGAYRILSMRVAPRFGGDNRLLGLVGSAVDVSELKAAEEAMRRSNEELELRVDERTRDLLASLRELRESEETIRAITQSAQDAVVMLDEEGRVSFWNPAAERIFGWPESEVLGLGLDQFLLCEEHREGHRQGYLRFQSGGHGSVLGNTVELEALTSAGRRIPVELSLSSTTLRGTLHAIGLLRDISARKESEASLKRSNAELTELNRKLEEAQNQLLQSEKMASIGQLAAGVAHEINNPVGFVGSNLGSLRKYVDRLLSLIAAYQDAEAELPDAARREALAKLRREVELDFLREDLPALLDESEEGLGRVRRIVQDLKEFSHVNKAEWQPADLNAGLESTLNVVWNEVKYKAEVVKHYGELPPVECIAGQLNQVFMNLIVNAVQAIDNKGVLTLATGHEDGWVWVEVADTGKGMSEEVQRRVFEPFFTTKPVGKGTGLGLSLSFSIVKKHGGRIELQSEPGKGSRFRVWVPVRRPPGAAEVSQ